MFLSAVSAIGLRAVPVFILRVHELIPTTHIDEKLPPNRVRLISDFGRVVSRAAILPQDALRGPAVLANQWEVRVQVPGC